MADISQVTLLDNTTYDLKDATARKKGIFYGTCSTAADTAKKVVSSTFAVDGGNLYTGMTIAVKFTNSNTVASPTLEVTTSFTQNGSAATLTTTKSIKRYGTTAPSTSAATSWNAGAVVTFTYDGTYWQMHDWVNTTYSSMTVAEYEAGTGTTARNITPARLKGAILTWAPPVDHSSTATTYGTGTDANYGHVKLSASTSSTSGTSGGTAATPSAVKAAYDLANTANGTANSALSAAQGTLVFDTTYTISSGTATFSAHVYQNGTEITSTLQDSQFSWFYRLGTNDSTVSLGTGKTKAVTITTLGYGGHVGCTFDDGN